MLLLSVTIVQGTIMLFTLLKHIILQPSAANNKNLLPRSHHRMGNI